MPFNYFDFLLLPQTIITPISESLKVIEDGLGENIDLQKIGRIVLFLTVLYGLCRVFSYVQIFILTTVTHRSAVLLMVSLLLDYFTTNVLISNGLNVTLNVLPSSDIFSSSSSIRLDETTSPGLEREIDALVLAPSHS